MKVLASQNPASTELGLDALQSHVLSHHDLGDWGNPTVPPRLFLASGYRG